MSAVTEYQNEAAQRLFGLLPPELDVPVETEWQAVTSIQGIYSPRIDIAMGPFSVTRGESYCKIYDHLMIQLRPFINSLITAHTANVVQYRSTDDPRIEEALNIPTFEEMLQYNRNARCLFAIEIENQVTRKHLLGGVVYSSALGRMGIVIGWTEDKVRALVKLQAYWDFLRAVGKNTYGAGNLLILNPQQFIDAMNHA